MKTNRSIVIIALCIVVSLLFSACATKPTTPTTTEFLIDECATAMGGIEKIDSLQTMRFSQYLPDHGGISKYEIKRPNLIRLGDQVASDGERAFWLTKDDPIPQEEWQDFEVDIAWYIPAFFDYPAEYLGTEVVDDIETQKLQVTLPLGAVMTYYLDAETHLIYKAVANFTINGTEYHPERIYSDYQLSGEIIYPHAFTYEGRDGVFTATFLNIEFNIPLEDERFSDPWATD